MMINTAQIEIELICIAILFAVLFAHGRQSQKIVDHKIFGAIVILTVGVMASDIVTWWSAVDDTAALCAVHWVSAWIYYLLQILTSFAWMLYSESRLFGNFDRLRRHKILCILPLVIYLIMLAATPVTHWMFYVTDENRYFHGSLYVLQAVVAMSYMAHSTVAGIKKACRETVRSKRREYVFIAAFGFPALIGLVVQSAFYGLVLVWPCITISILVVFLDMQNSLVSTDALTGINNRGRFDRYIDGKLSDGGDNIYIVMIDIDGFKRINDTYGHAEGDELLIAAAEFLKYGCERRNDFLARYGGDEFAIVCMRESEGEMDSYIDRIAYLVRKYNANSGKPYKLSLSAGYARMGEVERDSVAKAIARADKKMYAAKSEKKKIK